MSTKSWLARAAEYSSPEGTPPSAPPIASSAAPWRPYGNGDREALEAATNVEAARMAGVLLPEGSAAERAALRATPVPVLHALDRALRREAAEAERYREMLGRATADLRAAHSRAASLEAERRAAEAKHARRLDEAERAAEAADERAARAQQGLAEMRKALAGHLRTQEALTARIDELEARLGGAAADAPASAQPGPRRRGALPAAPPAASPGPPRPPPASSAAADAAADEAWAWAMEAGCGPWAPPAPPVEALARVEAARRAAQAARAASPPRPEPDTRPHHRRPPSGPAAPSPPVAPASPARASVALLAPRPTLAACMPPAGSAERRAASRTAALFAAAGGVGAAPPAAARATRSPLAAAAKAARAAKATAAVGVKAARAAREQWP